MGRSPALRRESCSSTPTRSLCFSCGFKSLVKMQRSWLLSAACTLAAVLWQLPAAAAAAAATAAAPGSLHLVVPCYNEAKRLPATEFEDYAATHPGTSFTFVNDGSTDGTLEMLTVLAAKRPSQLHVLDLVTNRGKAEATRLGMVAVLEGGVELVGFWDGDLATPLTAVDEFTKVSSAAPCPLNGGHCAIAALLPPLSLSPPPSTTHHHSLADSAMRNLRVAAARCRLPPKQNHRTRSLPPTQTEPRGLSRCPTHGL